MKKNILFCIIVMIILYAVYIMYIVAKEKFPEIDKIEQKQKTTETKKESVKAPEKKVEKVEKVVEIPPSKYTKEEIENAKSYVGNYNYIVNEINKSVLKCISESGEKTEETHRGCYMSAMRKFNMDADPEAQKRIKIKYEEQLAIARS